MSSCFRFSENLFSTIHLLNINKYRYLVVLGIVNGGSKFEVQYGVPEGTRTPNLRLRRPSLYPLSYRDINSRTLGFYHKKLYVLHINIY